MSTLTKTILLSLAGVLLIGVSAMGAEKAADKKAEDGKKKRWRLANMAYTYRNFTLFETIDKTKEVGLKNLETFSWQKIGKDFKDMPFNQDAPADVLKKVTSKMEEAGVKFSGFYFHELGKDEAVTVKVFEFCKQMKIPTIICEPPPASFDMLDKLANEYKVNVAVHNHPGPTDKSPYWNPDEVLKQVKGHGSRIGMCVDTGHWVRSGLDPIECLKKCEGKIIQLHLKDIKEAKKESPDVPWGTGIGNVEAQLKELDRQNFTGVFSMEYESNPENPTPDVKKCIEFFRTTAKKLGR